jgi:hypothetical protein
MNLDKNLLPDNQINDNYFSTMYCIVPFNNYIFASSSTKKVKISIINAMKTFLKQLTALILTVAWSSSLTAAIPVLNDAGSSAGQNELVRAKLIDGVWMPVVDLPEVEISASRIEATFVKGQIKGNELVAQVNLPEVVIEARSIRLLSTGSDIISDNNLPVIEITASFPEDLLKEAEQSENGLIAVIRLPEIVIEGSRETDTIKLIPDFAGILDALSKENEFLESSETIGSFKPVMHENILMTAKRCIREEGEKLICDVSMMVTSRSEASGLKEKIFRLVLNYH